MATPTYGIDVPSFHPGDPPDWQWRPPRSPLLAPLLTNAGLSKNRRQQRFDYNVAESAWSWDPGGSALLAPLLTNAGLSKNRRQARFDYNDQSVYSIIGYNRNQNLLISGAIPFSFEYHRFNYDDKSVNSIIGYNRNQNLLMTGGNPFVNEGWHYDYNDASFWSGEPNSSALLAPLLTAVGKPPQKPWRVDYQYDDSSNWQHVLYPNASVFYSAFAPPPPSDAWHLDYDDSAFWFWQSPSAFQVLEYAGPPVPPVTHGVSDLTDPWYYDWWRARAREAKARLETKGHKKRKKKHAEQELERELEAIQALPEPQQTPRLAGLLSARALAGMESARTLQEIEDLALTLKRAEGDILLQLIAAYQRERDEEEAIELLLLS